MIRDDEWDLLLDEVSSFCEKHVIEVPNMTDAFFARKRSQRKAAKKTNLHRYRVELFCAVIDLQLQELNGRFNEVNSELLLCVACLCPDDAFVAFDKEKLIRLARLYPNEFSTYKLIELDMQLGTYILDMQSSPAFKGLNGISSLAKKMIETKKNEVFPLVYLLVTLALILPVATASVERAFSAMNIVKTSLRNRMEDQWMNDTMIVYVEKDVFAEIDDDLIIQRFQKMKSRRGQL